MMCERQNPDFNILAKFNILESKNTDFKIVHDQNPEFKILTDWILAALQHFDFPNSWIQDFGKLKCWFFWKAKILNSGFLNRISRLRNHRMLPFWMLLFLTTEYYLSQGRQVST